MSDCSRSECIGVFPGFSGWWQAPSGGGGGFRAQWLVLEMPCLPCGVRFDLTFGCWWPYNNSICEKRDPPIKDKKSQCDIAIQRWTDTGIILGNWFHSITPTKVSSSMTAWIPPLNKGSLFGVRWLFLSKQSIS